MNILNKIIFTLSRRDLIVSVDNFDIISVSYRNGDLFHLQSVRVGPNVFRVAKDESCKMSDRGRIKIDRETFDEVISDIRKDAYFKGEVILANA